MYLITHYSSEIKSLLRQLQFNSASFFEVYRTRFQTKYETCNEFVQEERSTKCKSSVGNHDKEFESNGPIQFTI